MRVAILNSRQSKTPIGSDPWVKGTIAAVDHVAETEGAEIVSSVGLLTWDLVTWCAGQRGLMLDLVVPGPANGAEEQPLAAIIADFDLDPRRVRWDFIEVGSAARSNKTWWRKRDRRVIEQADIVFPVSLRKGGQLEQLLAGAGSQGGIDRRFATAYDPRPHHLRQPVDPAKLTREIRQWSGDYIIHWTRACLGPWPGETKSAFFKDLCGQDGGYCRSGLKTLQRILREGVIRASSWRIGGGAAMVALTELSPLDTIPLMRWRARWSRWSLEPYGIAIDREWATVHGARPVQYVTDTEWASLPPDAKPFCHRAGTGNGAWPPEREWRFMNDVVLSRVPSKALRILVREGNEKTAVADLVEAPVYSFN